MKKQMPALILVLFIFMQFPCCHIGRSGEIRHEQVRIALYIDDSVWPMCKTLTETMVKELGLFYAIVDRDSIRKGDLEQYSVLLMPGGNPDLCNRELGTKGKDEILAYVRRGGGYLGICGGAYFAAETNIWTGWSGEPRHTVEFKTLGVFSGTAFGPIEEFAPTYYDPAFQIEIVAPDHPACQGLPATITYLYDHGPEFILKNDDTQTVTIGRSIRGNKTMIIGTCYHSGRVFLTSGHPEADSSKLTWTMVSNALRWCSRL